MGRLILLLTLLSHPLFAFTLNNNVGAAFEKDEVSVNVASHSCSNIGITNDELLSIAEEAVDLFWNRVHSSRLQLKRGSLTSVSTSFQTGLICNNDPQAGCSINSSLAVSSDILISCNTNATNFSNSNSVLMVTVPNNVSGDNILGALILINDTAGNSFQGLSRAEKVSSVAHEIGHAIGLGHTGLEQNLMYFQSMSTREALGHDDVDGITYLYPVEQPIGGCGTIDFNEGPGSPGKSLPYFLLAFVMTLLFGSALKKRSLQKNDLS